jgi:branched-chain amino acid transport system permease protein
MLPSGVYFESFDGEAAYLRTTPQRAALAVALAALALAPFVTSSYVTGILTAIAINVIAVAGLQITTGTAGLLNLGQSAFVGIGAFVAASLANRWSVPLWIALPCAGFGAAVVSILFSLPAMRIKGFYLALTTIAAQIMFPIVVIRLPASVFGGPAGMAVDPPTVFGVTIDTPRTLYWLSLFVCAVMMVLAFNLQRTRMGRAFHAMRDNDLASAVLGVNQAQAKVLAFFAGAFFAGVSGALTAYQIRYVTTDQFTLWLSVWYVGMLIVGGMGSPLGAILGTIAITVLQEGVHQFGGWLMSHVQGVSGGVVFAGTNVVLGGAIVLMLIFEPHGLTHRWNLIKGAYRIWPYPRSS